MLLLLLTYFSLVHSFETDNTKWRFRVFTIGPLCPGGPGGPIVPRRPCLKEDKVH